MALPAAPTEAGGAKLHYLVDDNAGTNRANAFLGIGSTTMNTERVAHLGIASHILGAAPGGTDPVILIAASDGTVVRALRVDTDGRLEVVGNIAHDAPDSGAPVKIGGKATSGTPTSVADADRVQAWFDTRGALGTFITEKGNATSVSVGTLGDASGTVVGLYVNTRPSLFNGTTWDRVRGDITNGLDVDVTRMPRAATSALSNVASSASSVTLLAANAARIAATIFNDSTEILYVKFGTTASATSFTVELVARAYYEVPEAYTGRIDGIWVAANGNARVTEMTV